MMFVTAPASVDTIANLGFPSARITGFIAFASPETDADKCTAAVSDHNGNRQSHYRKRKYDRVGRIAIRAEVIGIGNKDLNDFPMT